MTIILTRTATRFAEVIRLVTHKYYNHISISLDDDLSEVYSFARKAYNTPVDGGFVHESTASMTIDRVKEVPCRLYRVPLTDEQYEKILELVNNVRNDEEYVYNLFSAISFPIFKGFVNYKAFTCSEFAAWLLISAGYPLNKTAEKYLPEELSDELQNYLIYEGDLLQYGRFRELNSGDDKFLAEMPVIKIVSLQASAIIEQAKRLVRKEGE